MKKSYIYKDSNNEVFYVNNKGEEFLLTEAVSPINRYSYDLVIAMKLNPKFKEDPDNEIFYDTEADPIWFAGADGIRDLLNGEQDWILESCKQFLDDRTDEQKIGKPEVFYTGGGIWISAMYVDEHRYYTIDNADNEFCLSLFDSREEDDENFCCQNLCESKSVDELSPEELAIYNKLTEAMKREAH